MRNVEFEKYLEALSRQCRLGGRERADLRRELEAHFDDAVEAALAHGASEREAVDQALAEFGDPAEFATAMNQPLLMRRILMRTILSAACVAIVATGVNFLSSSLPASSGHSSTIALADSGGDLERSAPAKGVDLERRIQSIDLKDAPLSEVFDYLREALGCNVFVRWQQLANHGIERDRPVTIQLKNITARQLLELALAEISEGDAIFRVDDNILVITSGDDRPRELVTRVYDVTDMVGEGSVAAMNAAKADKPENIQSTIDSDPLIRYFAAQSQDLDEQFKKMREIPGTDVEQAKNRSQREHFENQTGARLDTLRADIAARQSSQRDALAHADSAHGGDAAQKLVQILEGAIEPECWSNNGGQGYADIFRGALVVRQSTEIHERVAALLKELRDVAKSAARESAARAAR